MTNRSPSTCLLQQQVASHSGVAHTARGLWPRWVAANAFAELIGPGLSAFTVGDALIAVGMLLLTGGVVGALHGWVLVRMLEGK